MDEGAGPGDAENPRVGAILKDESENLYLSLEALPSYRPAVVMLDLGMPGMDGHEVARRIRQQLEFQDVTPIALTGWGQDEDRLRSQTAGFDYHLIKPADITALQSLLLPLERKLQISTTN